MLEKFDQVVKKTGKGFTRHTLAWRVIGHWRQYENGRRIFIKPYWKGLMENVKEQECRNREVVVP